MPPMVVNWNNNTPIPLTAANIGPTPSNSPSSSGYTVTQSDYGSQIASTNSGGPLTITLDSSLPSGFNFYASVDGNNITLTPTSGNVIAPSGNTYGNVSSPYTLYAENNYQSALVYFDGANWWLLTTQGSGQTFDIQFVISGGGAPITTGNKGWLHVPLAADIVAWRIMGDTTGSISVDIYGYESNGAPNTNSFVGSGTKPFVSSGIGNQAVPSGWNTTQIVYDNWISFYVDSISDFTLVTVCLTCTRI